MVSLRKKIEVFTTFVQVDSLQSHCRHRRCDSDHTILDIGNFVFESYLVTDELSTIILSPKEVSPSQFFLDKDSFKLDAPFDSSGH